VVATARQLADIRGLTLEEVAAHTWDNTMAAFGMQEEDVLAQCQAPNP